MLLGLLSETGDASAHAGDVVSSGADYSSYGSRELREYHGPTGVALAEALMGA